mmetsp:Transcript_60631/g.143059  ORF Transcript_60631/g.143059 Transcript_60631/m.143059 type:complete len:211 (+) Transcript_60631:485-1117(+)
MDDGDDQHEAARRGSSAGGAAGQLLQLPRHLDERPGCHSCKHRLLPEQSPHLRPQGGGGSQLPVLRAAAVPTQLRLAFCDRDLLALAGAAAADPGGAGGGARGGGGRDGRAGWGSDLPGPRRRTPCRLRERGGVRGDAGGVVVDRTHARAQTRRRSGLRGGRGARQTRGGDSGAGLPRRRGRLLRIPVDAVCGANRGPASPSLHARRLLR